MRSIAAKARLLPTLLGWAVAAVLAPPAPSSAQPAPFEAARIFIECNSSDNDLGFHVFFDVEDWKLVRIVNPKGEQIFQVAGQGPYRDLGGLSELFTEGAEPTLGPGVLAALLAGFPEGDYRFIGVTVDGEDLRSLARLSHAVPAGPRVSAEVDDNEVTISWTRVSRPPPGFPNKRIQIVGYQVIVGSFEVTLPASARSVELPEEFVASLEPGEHGFEVLAIDASGNQTITAGDFELD